MESKIEVFDKDGKALSIANVISRFLFEQAAEKRRNVEDLILGIELSRPIRDDGKNELQLMDDNFLLIDSTKC